MSGRSSWGYKLHLMLLVIYRHPLKGLDNIVQGLHLLHRVANCSWSATISKGASLISRRWWAGYFAWTNAGLYWLEHSRF